jgi:hypothetical protein
VIVILAFVAGCLWGGILARRRKGGALDIAQYAVAFGMAFAIVGLFATVLVQRLL